MRLTWLIILVFVLAGCVPQALAESYNTFHKGTIQIADQYADYVNQHEVEPERSARLEILRDWLELAREIQSYMKGAKANELD